VDHVQRGQAAQAERLAGQAAPALERLCGPASGLVLETRNTWACALHLLNRLPEAEREFTIVHRGLKTAYGPGSPQALVALFSLASVAADAGKHAEAVTRFQELIDVVGKAPEGGRRLVVLRTHQALSLAETGDPAKAETQLRECLAQLQKQPGSRDQDTLWVRLYLGRALYLQGRYAEAEPCLRRGQELLAAEAGYSEYRKQRALQWLGDLYQAWGQPAEAARWHDQARELGASRPQPP
jgi:tetratricopeptide (TPR) repeat protein